MAPVVKALDETSGIESGVCVSAQHRVMLDQVLDLFDIRPDYDLDIMRDNQDLAYITQSVLTGMFAVFDDFKPGLHKLFAPGSAELPFPEIRIQKTPARPEDSFDF